MGIEQINGLNQESSGDSGLNTDETMIDWEVDSEGNIYRSGDKFRDNLTDLKDEFKESS